MISLGLAQGRQPRRAYVRRALLAALDEVIRPLDPADNPARKEPASVKKLAQGDASWSTQKILLGWLVDTVQGTIQLPPHRVDRLHTILAEVRGQRRISLRRWRVLLGELRSMMVALPGSEGLFSHLQDALVRQRGRPHPRHRGRRRRTRRLGLAGERYRQPAHVHC